MEQSGGLRLSGYLNIVGILHPAFYGTGELRSSVHQFLMEEQVCH